MSLEAATHGRRLSIRIRPAPLRRLHCLGLLPLVTACSTSGHAPWVQSTPAPATTSASAPAGDAEDLAKKLASPVAQLISVPLQLNYDQDIGPGDEGERWQLNVQPVIPIHVNQDWNLLSRPIVPIIDQRDVPVGQDDSGLGDITQSFFLSPSSVSPGGLVWGVGPEFLIPTATEPGLGTEKWGLGPTAVVLQQSGANTLGLLANHVWPSRATTTART